MRKHLSTFQEDAKNTFQALINNKLNKSQSMKYVNIQTQHEHPKQIKIISPFYDKGKCYVRGPCLCPFHRKKKEILFNKINRQRSEKKKQCQKIRKIKYRKIQTQQCEHNKNITQINDSLGIKRIKIIGDKQNYVNISHKVQCRNSQFEYFLKKNELFILTGKLPSSTKNKQDTSASDDNFLQDFYKNFNSEMQSKQFIINQQHLFNAYLQENRNLSRKGTKKTWAQFKKFGEGGLITRMKQVIYSVLNEQKKISLKAMKKLKETFADLIDEQKQIQGESNLYKKNRQCLDEFSQFLLNKIKKQQKNKNQRQNTLQNYKQDHNEEQYQTQINASKKALLKSKNNQKTKNQQNTSKDKNKNAKNQHDNCDKRHSSSNLKQTIQLQNKQSIEQQKMKQNTQKSSASLSVDSKFGDSRNISFLNCKKKDNGKIKRNIQNKTNKNMSFIRQLSVGKNSKQMNRTDQDLNKQTQKNGSMSCHTQNLYHKKNQKQIKLQQILNHMKNDEVVMDANFIKMKKYIEKNKKFIKKMEIKLLKYNLGAFVIEEADSLITRKKKIRMLKQLIADRQNIGQQQSHGHYDQIIKYLDIYTEHCNMMMKKQAKRKRKQEQDFAYQQQSIAHILTSKDCSKSLKFINLHENHQNEKEKKLQGWISIPQYITNDETRLKNYQNLQKSIKYIQKTISRQKQEYSPHIQMDYLVQMQLDGTCRLEDKMINHNFLLNKQNQLQNENKQKQKLNKQFGMCSRKSAIQKRIKFIKRKAKQDYNQQFYK